MSTSTPISEIHLRVQELRTLFIDHEDARKVSQIVGDIVGEFLASQQFNARVDTRGLVVLGKSGTGKTESVIHALSKLGLKETKAGDNPRPFLVVQLSADATLRRVCSDTLREYGWPAKARDNAQQIWSSVRDYVARLQTVVLVLDEIQHVRSAGPTERAALRDFLKSLVQPRQIRIVPIVVGMPEFEHVLNSDVQLRRRFDLVHMRSLDPAIDRERAIRTLNQYASHTGLNLSKSVTSRDFAARLLHASNYAFGEMCAVCLRGVKRALIDNGIDIEIAHFEEAHRLRYDCVPGVNPFIAADFHNIQIGDTNADDTP